MVERMYNNSPGSQPDSCYPRLSDASACWAVSQVLVRLEKQTLARLHFSDRAPRSDSNQHFREET
jgi:hypothetical protein